MDQHSLFEQPPAAGDSEGWGRATKAQGYCYWRESDRDYRSLCGTTIATPPIFDEAQPETHKGTCVVCFLSAPTRPTWWDSLGRPKDGNRIAQTTFDFTARQPSREGPPMNTEQRSQIAADGAAAFAAGTPVTDLPYPNYTSKADAWMNGWWRAFYAQKREDQRRITAWLDRINLVIFSSEQAEMLAAIVVNGEQYNRTMPIDVKIGALQFTIPAPATLPA